MELYFILHNPIIPENVGAAARALATMGFNKLRLVNPCNHLQDRAKWLACSAFHVLRDAEVFTSLGDALADIDYAVATTCRTRHRKRTYPDPEETKIILSEREQTISKAAVVFGPENRGLENQEIELCNLVSSIRTSESYNSLNLAQAVMVYAYQLSSLVLTKEEPALSPVAAEQAHAKAKIKTEVLLQTLDIERSLPVYSRIIERVALLKDNDLGLFHFLADRLIRVTKSDSTN